MPSLDQTRRQKQAQDLIESWGRVSRQHMSAGAGCGCGFGGLILQASDFELDIVEFLINDARKDGMAGVEAFVNAVARRGAESYSLSALLQAISDAEVSATANPDELEFAIERLTRTLSSMEKSHSKGRFICD
jgi:hypothetical protein